MRACILGAMVALIPAVALAQNPKGATYITAEEVALINKSPGVDRQIVNVDIGKSNLAVGVVHRGRSGAPAKPAAPGAPAAPAAPANPPQPCGDKVANVAAGTASGIAHDGQTETYIIISGGGTLVTGGRIVNGRRSAPESQVTQVLNGPSCSGPIVGDDVVKKVVKVGDIIIIPAGVPHGWEAIGDHVDYLTVRPDPDRVIPKLYTNPLLQKK
jgi:mannose-6-phosphate isomerase-like protein (cupin superfamily)